VVVIGDTPKDIDAAQAIGAQSVAVATGGFTLAQLKEAGATWVFETLAAPGALEALLHER
jgi:phosphoglycolate phosphatase-like HAD superfamily hydrolase